MTPAPAAGEGPIVQSVGIGFTVLRVAIVLLALGWVTSNLRQVPPDTQALVLRFGQIVAAQQSGLVLAWPRPIEEVALLPGPNRQMELKIAPGTGRSAGIVDPASAAAGQLPPETAGSYLTGDGGIVLLDAALTWRITDPAAYYVAAQHVEPALQRVFVASAVALAAARSMDDFMVVRPERAGNGPAEQAQREALRGDLAKEVNRRLREIERSGAGIGVDVARVDVVALLPPATKLAFDAVLEATQMADQGLAAARTDAARTQQSAERDRDRILSEASAAAQEHVAEAHARVAAIVALEQRADLSGRFSLLSQLYRERIVPILHNAGSVITTDGRDGGQLVLPGGKP